MSDLVKKRSEVEGFLEDFKSLYLENQGLYWQLKGWFDFHDQPRLCRRAITEWMAENTVINSDSDCDMIEHAVFIAQCITELDFED